MLQNYSNGMILSWFTFQKWGIQPDATDFYDSDGNLRETHIMLA